MEFTKYFPIHAHDSRLIIIEACKTIKLNPETFITSLEKELGHKINLENPLITDWIYMCELLALDLNCISYGYLSKFHLHRIKQRGEKFLYNGPHPETYGIVFTHISSLF